MRDDSIVALRRFRAIRRAFMVINLATAIAAAVLILVLAA